MSTMTRTLSALANAALTAGAVFFCVPASAATPDMLTRQVAVSYSDLDLSTPADRATLQGRIHQAASAVCTAQGDDVAARIASSICRKQAITEASRRMDTVIASATSAKRVALR